MYYNNIIYYYICLTVRKTHGSLCPLHNGAGGGPKNYYINNVVFFITVQKKIERRVPLKTLFHKTAELEEEFPATDVFFSIISLHSL